MGSEKCPFGECERSKVIEAELLVVNKTLAILASRVRLLQFLVIGGWLLDMVVKNVAKATPVVAFFGR